MKFICCYNPRWATSYSAVVNYLLIYVPQSCQFHHIGSTSIPGMPAKDIVDLTIECPVGSMPETTLALGNAGYEHQGDLGIPTREAFRPLPSSDSAKLPPHHLYACQSGSPELLKNIAFREYLKSNPARAEWLGKEKSIADEKAGTRMEYITLKAPAYEAITKESLQWANGPSGIQMPNTACRDRMFGANEQERNSTMVQYKAEFDKLEWESPIAGMRHKYFDQDGLRLRLVEYSKGMPLHWCVKGHYGYLIEGQMEIEYENTRAIYKPGDGIFIPDGPAHKHQGKLISEKALVFFVEKI